MSLVREGAKLIGWVTASLAGMVAILYACGFLIIQTQARILGIQMLLASGQEYYVQEGAKFFIVTGQKLGLLLLGLVTVVLVCCIPVVLALTISEKLVRYVDAVTERSLRVYRSHRWLCQAGVLLVMVVLLFFPIANNLDLFRAPLELSNLLHSPQDSAAPASWSTDAKTIGRWVMTSDTANLDVLYYRLLMHCVLAAGLLAAVQAVTSRWRLRRLVTLPFLLVLAIYLLLVPLDYVVLEKRMEFPPVTVLSSDEAVSKSLGALLLVSKTDQEVILWDQTRKQTLWLPRDKVMKLEIGPTTPVFRKGAR